MATILRTSWYEDNFSVTANGNTYLITGYGTTVVDADVTAILAAASAVRLQLFYGAYGTGGSPIPPQSGYALQSDITALTALIAGAGDLPEYAAPPALSSAPSATAMLGKTVSIDAASGLSYPMPTAVVGSRFAVRQAAGTGALVFTAAARTDTGATLTSGSATVADTAITAADRGRLVTATGIPAGTYVGTVTPGTSFLLSSSPDPTVQTNATATGSGTVSLTISDLLGVGAATTYPHPGVGAILTWHVTQPGRWTVAPGSAAPVLAPDMFDDFRGKGSGPLTVADSGHAWLNNAAGGQSTAITSGAMGNATGHVPGSGATYPQVLLPGRVLRMGMTLRWDASNSVASSVTLGAFTTSGFVSGSTSASIHLSIAPWGCQFSVFAGGIGDFTSLIPEGHLDSFPRFAKSMRCDGVTEYPVEIAVDLPNARAYVRIADQPVLVFKDARIASVDARYPFWESYSVSGGTNLARQTRVWAASSLPSPTLQQPDLVATLRSGSSLRRGGAGLVGSRGHSRMHPGSSWTDTGFSTTLSAATTVGATSLTTPLPLAPGTRITVDTGVNAETRWTGVPTGTGPYTAPLLNSYGAATALAVAHASGAAVVTGRKATTTDGLFWYDPSGLVVGNRYAHPVSASSEDTNGIYVSANGTAALVRQPNTAWGDTAAVYAVTATASGNVTVLGNFINAVVPVEPGYPFAATLGKIATSVTRTVQLGLQFITDTSGTAVGALINGSAVSVAAGTPVTLPIARGICPTGAAAAYWSLTLTGAAAGEVFYFSQPMIALDQGLTGYVNT